MNFLGHITMYSVSTSVSFPSNHLPIFYTPHSYRKMGRGWKRVGREGKEKDIRTIFSRLVQFVIRSDTFGHFWSSHLPVQHFVHHKVIHHIKTPWLSSPPTILHIFLHTRHTLTVTMSFLVLFGMLCIHEWSMCFFSLIWVYSLLLRKEF